jgi:predicted GIY-YIG superfamily endonuclease
MSIYAYSYNNELLYIGSTMDLKDREKKHKKSLKTGKNEQPFHRYLKKQNLNIENLHKDVVETAIFEKEPLEMLELGTFM